MPKGGLSNLIALPLQKIPRAEETVFLSIRNSVRTNDQWASLASVERMSADAVEAVVRQVPTTNRHECSAPFQLPFRIRRAYNPK